MQKQQASDKRRKHVHGRLQIKGLVWGTGQALLRSPRGRNASRDGLVKLGWVHCLQYTLNCFQDNVCGLCQYEPSNHV